MITLIILTGLVLLYSAGIYQTACLTIMCIIMALITFARATGVIAILTGAVDPLPSEWESIKIQWAYSIATGVAMYAMWVSGWMSAMLIVSVSIPFALVALYYLIQSTTFRLSEKNADTDPGGA